MSAPAPDPLSTQPPQPFIAVTLPPTSPAATVAVPVVTLILFRKYELDVPYSAAAALSPDEQQTEQISSRLLQLGEGWRIEPLYAVLFKQLHLGALWEYGDPTSHKRVRPGDIKAGGRYDLLPTILTRTRWTTGFSRFVLDGDTSLNSWDWLFEQIRAEHDMPPTARVTLINRAQKFGRGQAAPFILYEVQPTFGVTFYRLDEDFERTQHFRSWPTDREAQKANEKLIRSKLECPDEATLLICDYQKTSAVNMSDKLEGQYTVSWPITVFTSEQQSIPVGNTAFSVKASFSFSSDRETLKMEIATAAQPKESPASAAQQQGSSSVCLEQMIVRALCDKNLRDYRPKSETSAPISVGRSSEHSIGVSAQGSISANGPVGSITPSYVYKTSTQTSSTVSSWRQAAQLSDNHIEMLRAMRMWWKADNSGYYLHPDEPGSRRLRDNMYNALNAIELASASNDDVVQLRIGNHGALWEYTLCDIKTSNKTLQDAQSSHGLDVTQQLDIALPGGRKSWQTCTVLVVLQSQMKVTRSGLLTNVENTTFNQVLLMLHVINSYVDVYQTSWWSPTAALEEDYELLKVKARELATTRAQLKDRGRTPPPTLQDLTAFNVGVRKYNMITALWCDLPPEWVKTHKLSAIQQLEPRKYVKG